MAAFGPDNVLLSTPLAGTLESSTATAEISFEPGFSAVQLRAFFDAAEGEAFGRAMPPGLRDLRTLSGERITGMQYVSTMGGGWRVVYVTESGRKIPVEVW